MKNINVFISNKFFICLFLLFGNLTILQAKSFQSISESNIPNPVFQNHLGTFYEDLSFYNISTDKFNNQLIQWFNLDDNHSLEKVREFIDEIGYKHESFQHFYKGLKVENDLVFVHSKSGKVTSVNGQLVRFENLDVTFNLSDEAIIQIAKTDFDEGIVTFSSHVDLVISKYEKKKKINIEIAKRVNIYSFDPIENVRYYLNNDGEIVNKFSENNHVDVPGSGVTFYNGTRNFTVDSHEGIYRLKDNFRNIHTFNGQNANSYSYSNTLSYLDTLTGLVIGAEYFTNSAQSFVSSELQPAVSLHWGMTQTFDYFKNIHNRNSFDNLGSPINSYYKFGPNYNAAALTFNQFDYFTFSEGGMTNNRNPFVLLEIVGHEFTHAVIRRNGNGGLNYQYESGAINESMADCFGKAIEFYSSVNPQWTVGEGIYIEPQEPNFVRSMEDPNSSGTPSPDTYMGLHWYPDEFTQSYAVHVHSGVGNFWFYLLSKQEFHTGVNDIGNSYYVQGIGINKAEKIVYKALMEGLTPTATYLDYYNATKQVAIALYGVDSYEYVQVVNAWYAVGVGDVFLDKKEFDFKSNLKIYPNPTKEGKLTIDSQFDEKVTLQVYDILGKQVSSIFELEKGINQINIDDLSHGIYFLVFKTDEKTHTEKLIKN